jgi:hypothetical protein
VKLSHFYYAASSVLSGSRDIVSGGCAVDFRENFINALAWLVLLRRNSREMVDEFARVKFLFPKNSVSKVASIRDAADALQEEIATLQVLIQNFKATRVGPPC